MAWEELKSELSTNRAAVVESAPLWQVTGSNRREFQAHPAFLDSLRISGDLNLLLNGAGDDFSKLVSRLRVTFDSQLTDIAEARTAFGLSQQRYDSTPERIALLAHYRSAKNLGIAFNSNVLSDAGVYADSKNPASVADFVQLHAVFLAAVTSFRTAYQPAVHPGRVEALHKLALNSARATRPVAIRMGTRADWLAPSAGFVTAACENAAQLNFATENALVGHALKHILMGTTELPTDQEEMDSLVESYLKEARGRIATDNPQGIHSALGQAGGTRTYYFGTVNVDVVMVAVNESGDAWISTFYRSGRH